MAIDIAQARVKEDSRHRIHHLPPYTRSAFGPYLYRDYDDEDEDPTYEDDEPVEVFPHRIVLRRPRTIVS